VAGNWHGVISGNISAAAWSKRGNKQKSSVITVSQPRK
jgi:hypothetical protein